MTTEAKKDEKHSLDDLRQMGNHAFSSGDFDTAWSLYTAAIERADESGDKPSLVLNLCNRSACYAKMERYEEAQTDAAQAVELSSGETIVVGATGMTKALYRLAKAQISLKAFGAAEGTIDAALEVFKRLAADDETANETNKGQIKAFQELLAEVKQSNPSSAPDSESAVEEEAKETSMKEVHRGISIREFIKGRDLGVGNFSEIVICTHKVTGEAFALKIIEKKRAADLAKRQHPNVYNEIQMERRILLERLPRHDNIVHMFHAFQDYNSLYYLMELHEAGGELWSSLRDENRKMVGCHRSLVKVYLAELLNALEHMHTHGIVHRDLKPENILFTKEGHLLVIDFGTAKDLIQTDLNGPEFVGTPDFMSPEAVSGTSGMKEVDEARKKGIIGADHTLDLYSLGAVAFQLHTGMTPYWCPSPYLAFLKIKRGNNLMRPWGIADDDAWDFISCLMQRDPKTRLGADCFAVKGSLFRKMVKQDGGYDTIRQHPYFSKKNEYEVPALDPAYAEKTPIPSLRDLCIRACAEQVRRDAEDLELCDKYPPGDGSKHDMLRLDARDRRCVMHHLERRKLLKEPTIYRRFFDSPVGYRLDKIRPASCDYVGLTRMSDEQHKFPDPREHDPYAEVTKIDPIHIVQITNPLLVREISDTCSDEERKAHMKLFKKCIANINRTRPKLVVVSGVVNDAFRKLLARINDSIPVVVIDGSSYFSFWLTGIQCLAIQSNNLAEDGAQIKWIREELEQCRMAKYHLFCFVDADPRSLPAMVMKRLARGKAHMVLGLSSDAAGFQTGIVYQANETVDDASVKSTDSVEDEMDNHVMGVVGTQENGLRCITVEDRETWDVEFKVIQLT
jgi:serine/threonine protein kinase